MCDYSNNLGGCALGEAREGLISDDQLNSS